MNNKDNNNIYKKYYIQYLYCYIYLYIFKTHLEMILNQHEIKNVDRDQFEDALKKYSQEYMEKGWCH